MGDCVNEVGYLVRPYETTPGATDAMLTRTWTSKRSAEEEVVDGGRALGKMANKIPMGHGGVPGQVLDQLYWTTTPARQQVRDCSTPSKSTGCGEALIVKVTGEFWRRPPRATATSACSASWSARARR
jgi:hypothetical protein